MKKREIAPGIMVYEDCLDHYEEVIEILDSHVADNIISWQPAMVKTNEDASVDTNTRDTLVIPIQYMNFVKEDARTSALGVLNSDLSEAFYNSLNPCEEDYKNFYSVATVTHDNYSILKYGAGQKFTNHIDDHQDYHRRVSTVCYLNDNYTGGEIVFPRFGITYKPKANEMIVFPSNYVYNHSVMPVTSGERYAIVSWLT